MTRIVRAAVLMALGAILLAAFGVDAPRASAQSDDGPGLSVSRIATTRDDRPDRLQATTNLSSLSDAFVSSTNADSNYGTMNVMNVGDRAPYGATRSLVWWDVKTIAKNQAVTGSKVRLFLRTAGPLGDSPRDVVMYRVKSSWPETGVTWNNFPSTDSTRLATTSLGVSSGGWNEWTGSGITEQVQRARLPTWNEKYRQFHGLYVQGYEAAGSYRSFDTREGSNKPDMAVEHVTDTWPPASVLEPLDPYTSEPSSTNPNQTNVPLIWTGTDPEPFTGIEFFRVYARRNQGDWVLSGDNIQAYAVPFPADNGGVYQFAVYGVDQAGNVELTKNPEAETHVDLSTPVTSMQALPQYVNGPFTISWLGQDEPTGADMVPSGLVEYNVYFRVNGGAWEATALGVTGTSKVFDDPLVDNATYEFVAGAFDKAGNLEDALLKQPQARTMLDRTPPTVTFAPVAGVDNPRFTVQWQGDDGAGSGTASYDIQFRRNSEPWQDWLTNTTRTSQVFQGEFTNVYEFRGRARDAAGNQGEYPADAQLRVGVIDMDDLPYAIDMPFAQHGTISR